MEIQVGPALESPQAVAANGEALFDFISIDANKDGYPDYFAWIMTLLRRGSVIIADNVVRDGAVMLVASD